MSGRTPSSRFHQVLIRDSRDVDALNEVAAFTRIQQSVRRNGYLAQLRRVAFLPSLRQYTASQFRGAAAGRISDHDLPAFHAVDSKADAVLTKVL
ncbi:MAG: hypothetical protein AAF989_13400 [Planctomycetota bacterium]